MYDHSQLRMPVSSFLGFCLVLLFVSGSAACAQDSMMIRKFVFEEQRSIDPIQLVGFRVSGEMIGSGTVFQASNEAWLRDSDMVVRNVSKREAVQVVVFLFFPETGESKPMVGDQNISGRPSS